jgi:hypothetical protein
VCNSDLHEGTQCFRDKRATDSTTETHEHSAGHEGTQCFRDKRVTDSTTETHEQSAGHEGTQCFRYKRATDSTTHCTFRDVVKPIKHTAIESLWVRFEEGTTETWNNHLSHLVCFISERILKRQNYEYLCRT